MRMSGMSVRGFDQGERKARGHEAISSGMLSVAAGVSIFSVQE